MVEAEWLVEIRVKELHWIHVPAGENPTVSYEEVLAVDEYQARHLAFQQFEDRCKYDPIMRRRMADRNLTPSNCCAPDAVSLTNCSI